MTKPLPPEASREHLTPETTTDGQLVWVVYEDSFGRVISHDENEVLVMVGDGTTVSAAYQQTFACTEEF